MSGVVGFRAAAGTRRPWHDDDGCQLQKRGGASCSGAGGLGTQRANLVRDLNPQCPQRALYKYYNFRQIFVVDDEILEGEFLCCTGAYDRAFDYLDQNVALQDALP